MNFAIILLILSGLVVVVYCTTSIMRYVRVRRVTKSAPELLKKINEFKIWGDSRVLVFTDKTVEIANDIVGETYRDWQLCDSQIKSKNFYMWRIYQGAGDLRVKIDGFYNEISKSGQFVDVSIELQARELKLQESEVYGFIKSTSNVLLVTRKTLDEFIELKKEIADKHDEKSLIEYRHILVEINNGYELLRESAKKFEEIIYSEVSKLSAHIRRQIKEISLSDISNNRKLYSQFIKEVGTINDALMKHYGIIRQEPKGEAKARYYTGQRQREGYYSTGQSRQQRNEGREGREYEA